MNCRYNNICFNFPFYTINIVQIPHDGAKDVLLAHSQNVCFKYFPMIPGLQQNMNLVPRYQNTKSGTFMSELTKE